jgi:hypothetical protein
MLQLAKVVARSMASGKPSSGMQQIGDALSSDPSSVCQVVDLIFGQAAKKKPAERILESLAFMLATTLEVQRWKAESHGSATTDLIEQVRQHATANAQKENASTLAIDVIAGAFAQAKLPLGNDFEAILENRFRNTPPASSEAAFAGFEQHLEEMVAALGGDPFLVHEQLLELLSRIPSHTRPAMIGMLPFMRSEILREAAAGWLLDQDDAVSKVMTDSLAQAAVQGLVSGNTVNRLIQIRNWIGEDRRPAVDSIVRTARQKGAAPSAAAKLQPHEIVVTAPDGAGAQSIHIRLRQRTSSSFANILVKHGFGIREAWVSPDMTQAEADQFLDQIFVQTDAYQSSLESVAALLRHGLAVNADCGQQIPFELLRVIEAIGLDSATPEHVDAVVLVDRIMAETGASENQDAAVKKAIAASRHWPQQHMMFDSWFEDLTEAGARAIPKGAKTARKRHVLEKVISPRRARWGELLAWSSFTVSEDDPELARDMALVAKLFLGDKPLESLPLAMTIAENTLLAAEQS